MGSPTLTLYTSTNIQIIQMYLEIYQSPLVKESQIFHHEEIFINNIPIYQQALKNSGFNNILTCR